MSENYPAAPRVFGTRQWDYIERLSTGAPSRNTAIDVWFAECEIAVNQCSAAGGEAWDNRRWPR